MIHPTIDSTEKFFSQVLKDSFAAFRVTYLIKTREENGVLLKKIVKTTVELDERKAAVAISEQRLKEVTVAVVASDAKTKKIAIRCQ
mmetsp:Transcript_34823/g.35379  ORF Transcript_34823/g.35379 Transcript_34823/m.35379 type:complete len:87 (-) Transcript_34823:776-1036(-)